MDRRHFLHTAGAAAAAAPQLLRGQQKVFRIGFIGLGRRGLDNMQAALKREDCQVVAICEIYPPNLEKARKLAPDAKVYPDFRDLIAAPDIDAICIATPDHWHAYMSVEACKAGKDVYVEKPISVTVHEGQMMVQAARKYDRVVQVGTQQRSGDHFQHVVEMIRADEIGDISFVRTWNYGNSYPEGIGNPPDGPPPEGLDWDMWLGPAPERPFNANRFGIDPNAFSHFRWFWDYAGGMMTDWGVHLLDIVLWATDQPGPTSVMALGDKYVLQDNRETPDTIVATYEFPSFACTYENRVCNAQSMFKQGYGILFHGTKGTLFVDRARWEILPETERVETGSRDRMAAAQGKAGNNSTAAHWEDFVTAMRDRTKPVSDILEGHRSTTAALLGNVAMRSRQRMNWDPVAETTDNDEARTYLRRDYRPPWKLEL
ncbi:MAG: gfo/Idh/MocA family oxidoreductase [Acidobacteria bacterium]|nr:gfo/Idh/MocA family oxidoreductase [Acidobacteriota bacterium]